MTGFISTTTTETQLTITNNTFFPDLKLADFRAQYRVDDTVTDERITQQLSTAMMGVNYELWFWQNKQVSEGYNSLEDVPGENYGNITDKQHYYYTAVFAKAKALIIEKYRDFDSTGHGNDKADNMGSLIDDYKTESREAIRRLLAISRSTVELI